MIEPTPEALLDGVADSLEQIVLPELSRGPLRNQVREAIRVIRHVVPMLDRVDRALRDDIADMDATLTAVLPAGHTLDVDSATDLRERHRALQNQAIAVDAVIHDLPAGASRDAAIQALRDLYRRMLLRERALRQPTAD